MKHFLVLGGGFAGVEAAIKLREKGHRVTLVSERHYLFIHPISIWIPVRGISFKNSKIPLESLRKKHGFDLVVEKVSAIDTANKTVKLANGELAYDYLFIALGMGRVSMKGADKILSIGGSPGDAIQIAKRLKELVKKGSGKIAIGFGGNPKDPSGSAVRGGPAFELLFNISQYLKKRKLLDKIELHFFAPMPEPGIRMGKQAFGKLDTFLKMYKVEKHVGVKITGFEGTNILFQDGTVLENDLVVFIPGGKGLPLYEESGLPLSEAGFIKTLETCQVEGHPEIYAIGDAPELMGPNWRAKQGHLAEIMAGIAAYNAIEHSKGSTKTKSYIEHVNIVCVMDSGNGAAYISRTLKGEKVFMLPVVGHWLKRAWGFYFKNSKMKRIPRIPGM